MFSRRDSWAVERPGAWGAAILLALFAAREFASATPERVYVLGHEAHWPCLFRRLFALPCPGCGLTRGSLLALDGHFAEAFALNAAAPLIVFGLAALAAALVALALLRRAGAPLGGAGLRRRAHTALRLYGALTVAVLFVNWVVQLLRA